MSIINTSPKKELVFYYEYNKNKNILYEDEILINGGSSSIENELYLEMKVPSQNDKVIRQTQSYFPSDNNCINHCIIQCILNTLDDSTGYISCVGIYDDHTDKTAGNDVGGSGYYFALIDGIMVVGYRNGITDNGTDVMISQENFNHMSLNLNHYDSYYWAQLHNYKIEYSNTGEVHFLIKMEEEKFELLHVIHLDDSRVHNIARYNLPIRYEIIKTGTENNIGCMRIFSSYLYLYHKFSNHDTLYGHILRVPKLYLYDIPEIINNGYIAVNSDNYKPIISLRLKSNQNRRLIHEINAYLFIKTNGYPCIFGIIKNPTFTATQPSWTGTDGSSIEYDTNANTIDQSNLLFLTQENLNIINGININNKIDICSDITGKPNVYTFCARKVSSNTANLIVGIKWYE